jgi:hypothetical protein
MGALTLTEVLRREAAQRALVTIKNACELNVEHVQKAGIDAIQFDCQRLLAHHGSIDPT